jgi:hypothetical protein
LSLAAAPTLTATAPRPGALRAPGALWRLARADFLERTRRPAYFVSLLVMAWLAHGMLPSATAGYRTFSMQDLYRPAYGPEWVGTLVGTMSGLYFVLVGFYLVKGAVDRDRVTGVGQILGASRLGRLRYLSGKALSNVLVLASMLVLALAVALVTQQLLGEDRRFDPLATALPLLAIGLPVAAVVGAGAVLIESIPGLAGGLGNVVWFIASMAALSIGIIDAETKASGAADLLGFSSVSLSTFQALHAIHPEVPIDTKALAMGVNVNSHWIGVAQRTFPWHGLTWDGRTIAGRLVWLAVAFACVGLASLVFDRFERPGRARAGRALRPATWFARRAPAARVQAHAVRVSALPAATRGGAFAGLVRAELALLLHGRATTWLLGAAGLMIATLLAPIEAVRMGLLPTLSIWPVLVIGALGARERQNATEALLFSAPRPVTRQLAAAWVAGTLLVLGLGAFGTLRLLVAGHAGLAAGWLFGSAFVSALALALGTWTGGSKFFEVLVLFAWYVGPMHHIAELDYTGVTAARPPALWLAYTAVLAGLLAAAWAGRARRVRG